MGRMERGYEGTWCTGLVYLVVPEDQVHVPESPCGGLRYDGVENCIF